MPKTAKKEEGTRSASPESGGKQVELSSLDTLQFFNYQGKIYSKRRTRPGGVSALSKKGDKLITLPPDTLVTPV
jgi:hypothetical protein